MLVNGLVMSDGRGEGDHRTLTIADWISSCLDSVSVKRHSRVVGWEAVGLGGVSVSAWDYCSVRVNTDALEEKLERKGKRQFR